MRRRRPPSVVIDTNLFVSGTIAKRGIPFQLLDVWRQGGCVLLLSPEQRYEIRTVFARPVIRTKYGLGDQELEILFTLLDAAKTALLRRRLPVRVRDPKDEMILAAALGGRADYLVSGDDDLLSLRDDPRIGSLRIVTAREFLTILSSAGD